MNKETMTVEEIVDFVFGRKYVPFSVKNLKLWIDDLLTHAFLYDDGTEGLMFNNNYTQKRLKVIGFTDEEIYHIRDLTVKSFHCSIMRMKDKYNIKDDLISKSESSFGVYQFFWNISDSVIKEANNLGRDLLTLKLKKIGYA